MPPAISDDESSDSGEVAIAVPTNNGTAKSTDQVEPDFRANPRRMTAKANDDEIVDDEDEADDQDEEGLEEDEFVVEKILGHIWKDPKQNRANSSIGQDTLRFRVKWEGYDKKSDQTWETEDNLLENASSILNEYLEGHGGKEKIIEDCKAGAMGKKRGRPLVTTPVSTGRKRTKRDNPESATPPATALKAWKPPAGSWDEHVKTIDACHDESTGKMICYLTWNNGQRTQHERQVVYQRAPQKMLQFYERHVKIVKSSPGET
ncbi:hypothetical protein BX600DRAFT_435689 [Xylariales sp. PMI_506]|nr:hypothetical protein BX600DRAFT_435689 [Xylariales sp. PMI_506]